MSHPKSPAGRTSGLTEVKLLFTAGSLATILLGWGALATQAKAPLEGDPVEEPPSAVPPSFAFLADPLPTIAVPGRQAGQAVVTESGPATLRAVDAPPPVQIITITKPGGGNNSGGGGGRTQSSK
jgi:hypothetical protein